jgi:hypothetical protein
MDAIAKLAELPLMKSYSPEELNKIDLFLRTGEVSLSLGFEWILEKDDYRPRHHMRDHAFLSGSGHELTLITSNQPSNQFSKVQFPDLHGPDKHCRIEVEGIGGHLLCRPPRVPP